MAAKLNDTDNRSPNLFTRKQIIGYSVGMTVGGLFPLVPGIFGVWSFITRGYVLARTGEPVYGLSGVWPSAVLVIAGLAMIVHAIRFYLRHGRSS